MENSYVAGQIWPRDMSGAEAEINIASDYLEAEAYEYDEEDGEIAQEMLNRNRREGELLNRALKEVTR